MEGLCSSFAIIWAPKMPGLRQPIVILCPLLGTPENAVQGLCSISALHWGSKTAGWRQPLVILSPLLGTPENAGVM